MKTMTRILTAALVAACALPAAAQMSREEAMKLADQYRGKVGGTRTAPPEPVELTQGHIDGFITAVGELGSLDLDADFGDAERGPGLTQAIESNAEAMKILKRNGFTPELFERVVYTIGAGIAGLHTKGHEGEIDRVLSDTNKALNRIEGQLTKEQIEMIRAQAAASKGAIAQIRDQSPGNLALIEANKDRLMKALDGASRR